MKYLLGCYHMPSVRTKNEQKSLLEFLTGDSRYKKVSFGAVDKPNI